MEPRSHLTKASLYDQADWFSKTFCSWVLPYFLQLNLSWRQLFTSLNYRQKATKLIELKDLHRCPRNDESGVLLATFRYHFKACQRDEAEEKGRRKVARTGFLWLKIRSISLISDNLFLCALMRMFSGEMVAPFLLTVGQDCVIKAIQPMLIGAIIAYFHRLSQVDSIQMPEDFRTTSTYCLSLIIMLCASSLILIALHHPSLMLAMRFSMRVKIVWTALIYDKCLRLSHSSQSQLSHLVNLMTNDIRRFDEFALMSQYLLIVPIQTVLLLALAWWYIGPICLVTFAAFIILAYLLSFLSRHLARLRSLVIGYTERRLKLLNEAFRHLRAVKIYSLEESFLKRIFQARKQELDQLSKPLNIQSGILSFSFVSGRVILYFTFFLYLLLIDKSETFCLETMFVSVAVFERLRYSLTWTLPQAVSGLHDILAACGRMDRFLKESEHQPFSGGLIVNNLEMKKATTFVSISGLYTRPLVDSTKTSHFQLQDISFELTTGQVLSIIGSVGCGKSAVLLTLFSEILVQKAAHFNVKGSFAYVGQDCYCLTATIRENILFGKQWDLERYAMVLEACALNEDLDALPLGDQTWVGENGLTLSGGQKARIGLARALYANKDIYLLDDPFSSVDVHIARYIYRKYIQEALADKIVLLATHQLQFVPKSDLILLLDNGRQVAFGDYQTLNESNAMFAKIFKKLTKNESQQNNEKEEEMKGDNDDNEEEEEQEKEEDDDDGNYKKKLAVKTKELSLQMKGNDDETMLPPIACEGKWQLLEQYWNYIKLGSLDTTSLALVLTTALLPQLLTYLCDHWLTLWNTTSLSRYQFLSIYTIIVISLTVCSLLRAYVFFDVCHRASNRAHNQTVESIIRAPIAYLDYVPIGRLIGHFARDVGVLDESLPLTWFELNLAFGQVAAIVIVIAFLSPYMILVTGGYFYFLYLLRQYFTKPSQHLRQLELLARNRIFDHLSSTLSGLVTIRAYERSENYRQTFQRLLNDHTAVFFTQLSSIRLFCTIIDFFALIYILTILLLIFWTFEPGAGGSGSLIALCLSSIFNLIGVAQWGWKRTIDSDFLFMSYLNLATFHKLPKEDEQNAPEQLDEVDDSFEINNTNQIISLRNVSVVYRRSDIEHFALKSINLTIDLGLKIGICGRSGSGKSTLLNTLLRFVDYRGKIRLGGQDLCRWPLASLRKKISIIPQYPVIFTGTIRQNLDLFGRKSDRELWQVLEKVNLQRVVESFPQGLDEPLSPDSDVISLGQKQLICLGRILLQQNHLVILDEATAKVDFYTDQLIQQTIRKEFDRHDCTVITIAHRLDSIIDYDRILVFDDGRLVESGEPWRLLEMNDGYFYRMVQETGSKMARNLEERAFATKTKYNIVT